MQTTKQSTKRLTKKTPTRAKKKPSKFKVLTDEQIQKQNKAFWKLPKAKKRVAIAKNVLEQIALKNYRASPGTYVYASVVEDIIYDTDNLDKEINPQSILLTRKVDCDVCGLGAAFVSTCRLGDRLDWSNADVPRGSLMAIFSPTQLSLIEDTFEETDNTEFSSSPAKLDIRSKLFWEKYPDPQKRLKAIFQNIVDNDGLFKP